MKKVIFFVLILTLVWGSRSQSPSFIVDLDASPDIRYEEIIKKYSSLLVQVGREILSDVSSSMKVFLENVYNTVTKHAFPEFVAEIRGMVRLLPFKESELFIINVLYEMRAMCTSLVARDAKGNVMLGRNLDFSFSDSFRKMHIIMIYKRKGKEVMRCGAMAGMLGFLTCMKPKQYAVSLNLRRLGSRIDTMKNFRLGRPPLMWLIRISLLQSNTYEEAKSRLSQLKSVSAGYITIAGIKPDEGSVITRGRDGAVNVQTLSPNKWYIAQCNSDYWRAHDQRTEKANEWMKQIGTDHITLEKMRTEVLFKPPLMQYITIATYLFSPVDSYMADYVPDTSKLPRTLDEEEYYPSQKEFN